MSNLVSKQTGSHFTLLQLDGLQYPGESSWMVHPWLLLGLRVIQGCASLPVPPCISQGCTFLSWAKGKNLETLFPVTQILARLSPMLRP